MKNVHLAIAGSILATTLVFSFRNKVAFAPDPNLNIFAQGASSTPTLTPAPTHPLNQPLSPAPTTIKAVYLTAYSAGNNKKMAEIISLTNTTELNAVVIDIKDYTGRVAFDSQGELINKLNSEQIKIPNLDQLVRQLHENKIYAIARIAVFQDPYLAAQRPDLAVKNSKTGATWKDRKGITWVDMGSHEVWDYNIEIASEAIMLGFDEINFDYIRYPSDGNMKDIRVSAVAGKTKAEVLESFFKYLHDALAPEGIVMSADLFGMTTTNTDDLNIGQQLEKTLPYFDYVAPMVYPSHYPPKFNGWSNPNQHPYDLIKFVMDAAVRRTIATTTPVETIGSERVASTSPQLYTKTSYSAQKMRPWLQDFDYGGNYDIAEVRAQIQASYDAGVMSFMIWAPSNIYTKGALKAPGTLEVSTSSVSNVAE